MSRIYYNQCTSVVPIHLFAQVQKREEENTIISGGREKTHFFKFNFINWVSLDSHKVDEILSSPSKETEI